MVQLMRYLRDAFHHTMKLFGGWSLAFAGGAIAAVGFGLHWWIAGRDAASLEFQVWLIYGLAATLTVFLVIFSFNFACAPYRLEREAHRATKAALETLRNDLPKPHSKRGLTNEQKSFLSDFLRSSGVRPEAFNVLYTSTSEESADFAADIGDAITAAGIECSVHDGVMFESNPRDRGLKLYYSDRSKVVMQFAEGLQSALREIGVFAERRPLKDSDSIFFYVARQSEN